MAKKVVAQIKLQIPAAKATPAPPVGPALGQHQVNIMDFCKNFNARTAKQEGLIIPVVITVYQDKSYTFITKTPPAAILLKRAAGIAKGSGEPNRNKVGKVTEKQVEEIAKSKLPDLNAASLEAAKRIIKGTARSMGLEIRGVTAMAGKKYTKAKEVVGTEPAQSLEDAVSRVKKSAYAKFDETVEIAMRLGVNPKHADQMVRGTVVLPHGLGVSRKVLVIASGEKMKEAQDAGADLVGGEEMVDQIQKGFMDFDAVVATPDMMRSVGQAR